MSRIAALFVLLITLPALAQQVTPQPTEDAPPNYRIQVFDPEPSGDSNFIVIPFGVSNIGGAAEIPATVSLSNLADGEVIATAQIRPLRGGGDTEISRISFPITALPSDTQQTLEISVGIDEIESRDSLNTIGNNYDSITVTIPAYETVVAGSEEAAQVSSSGIYIIPGLNIEIDTNDEEQMIVVGLIIVCVAVLLLILIALLRLMFRRKPAFGNWQPPYATMPPLDPNSTYGRRQLWQQHAQNNTVPVPCKMGSFQARKVLQGMDGRYLSGWKITALRMTQYDMYGRISRSQILASRGLVKGIDRVARKASGLEDTKLARRLRPAARSLANQMKRKVNKRTAMLPIALDVRLQGRHGEVRILFELYECHQGQPARIDYWEPEMTVLSKTIYESYTYTVYGQRGGEAFNAFRKRLSGDIEQVLVEMVRAVATTSELKPDFADDTAGIRAFTQDV